jgi:hypothetical protein
MNNEQLEGYFMTHKEHLIVSVTTCILKNWSLMELLVNLVLELITTLRADTKE